MEQGRKCVEICRTISSHVKKSRKQRKSNNEKSGEKQKNAWFIFDNEKQDPFLFVGF